MTGMKLMRALPVLVLAIAVQLSASSMTDQDREHLLVHFQMTTQMVAEQVRGLSPAQLEFKPAPDRWSIRQCVSHLAVAEPDYWRDLMAAVKAPPDMKGKKSSATDADILWYGIDRVVHTKTGGGHEKVDTYKDLGEALAKFQALRATMIQYIKTTHDDLRAHSFGRREPIDSWQWMLEISTHAERISSRFVKSRPTRTFRKNRWAVHGSLQASAGACVIGRRVVATLCRPLFSCVHQLVRRPLAVPRRFFSLQISSYRPSARNPSCLWPCLSLLHWLIYQHHERARLDGRPPLSFSRWTEFRSGEKHPV
jgi:hypothetical protein